MSDFLVVRPPFDTFPDPAGFFDWCMARDGEVFRDFPERRTLRFEYHGEYFFIKLHSGVGWKEIFKNLLQGRLPVLGAAQEWNAIRRLGELGVETMEPVAFGLRGRNPARQESFLVTRELTGTVSLEDLCADWKERRPPYRVKQVLLARVAGMSHALHVNGVNHRDFYLCHFLLNKGWLDVGGAMHLYLIDLHRAQIRRRTPLRWRVKDIGGLYFSAMDAGLTRRDLFRFMKIYMDKGLRQTLDEDRDFWRAVTQRAWRLYRSFHGRDPLPVYR